MNHPDPCFEVLIDDLPSSEEIPDTRWTSRAWAKRAALDLAERMAEGGYTGRTLVREADGLCCCYVKVRGDYQHIEDISYGDMPPTA